MNIERRQLPEYDAPSEEELEIRDAANMDELTILAQKFGYPPAIGSLLQQARHDPGALARIPTQFGIYDRAKELIKEDSRTADAS